MSDAASALPESVSALPPGTRLAEFEVKHLLGVGGFGIVYLAFDTQLEREVAVKEYMPASMAGRTETLHVSLRSQSDAEVFALGLRSFVNEAKLLARFDHPSLIKVHRFWEANGTAYMAMPVLRGKTLKDIRRSTGRAPDEAWIRATLSPLLGALEQLHLEGVYHRDIAPDNIHLEGDGRPVLLDFGAARRVISGKTQTLTAILKPAYAPIEQYAESAAVKQGPWTDLYALGATLHYMLLGYPPAPATTRTVSDESSGLTSRELPGVSHEMLAIIDWMLAPRPAERPQSVAELRAVLEGRAPAPERRAAAPPAQTHWDPNAPGAATVTVPLGEEPADLDLDMRSPPRTPAEAQAAAATRALPSSRGTVSAPRAASPTAAQRRTTAPRAGAPAQAPLPRTLVQSAEHAAFAADDTHRVPPPPQRSRWLPIALASVAMAAVAGYFGATRLAPGPGAAGAAMPGTAAASAAASSADGSARSGAAAPIAGVGPASLAPMEAASSAAAAAIGAGDSASPSSGQAASAALAGGAVVLAGAAGGAAVAQMLPASAAAVAAPNPARPTPAPTPATPAGRSTGAAGAGAAAAHANPAVGRISPGAAAGGERVAAHPAAGATQPPPSHSPHATGAPAGAGNPGAPGTAAVAVSGSGVAAGGAAPPAGVPASAVNTTEPGPSATPESRCVGRNALSHFVCMERECLRGRFKNHPQCEAWRQQARPRDGAGGG